MACWQHRFLQVGVWFIGTLFVLPTCTPPAQNGGVIVFSGASARLGTLCRFRHGDIDQGEVCPQNQSKVTPTRLVRIQGVKDRLAGPLAIGKDDDYLLDNGEIAVVIDQLGAGTGFAESGGNIIDVADARIRHDELGQVFTYFGVFPRQAIYETLKTGVDKDGTGWIEVSGHELYAPALRVTTRYSLQPAVRALLITTSLENTGDEEIQDFALGDAVQWGSAEKVAPGKSPGFTGDYEGPYLAGIGTSVAYALFSADGQPLTSLQGTAWSNIRFARNIEIPPKKNVVYERILAVAPRGDPLGIVTELLFLQGKPPGGLALELTDAQGKDLGFVAGKASITSLDKTDTKATQQIDLWLRLGHKGTVGGEVPPGRYAVSFEGSGRRSLKDISVEVRPGEVSKVSLPLTQAGRLVATIREFVSGQDPQKTPAKITLLDPVANKPLLPPLFTMIGELDIPLTPGQVRVIASRGPEFSLAQQTVEIQKDAPTRISLDLSRVVDTSGYVACDLHQHTALSADSGVSAIDRVKSNVVEGVECAVASEHNVIADLTPVVKDLGVTSWFKSIIGEELTSDASQKPFGHANVFPLEVNPAAARGGAFTVRDRTAKDIFDEVLARPGQKVIQINHPRSGRTGYFDQYELDHETGVGKLAGYDSRFDAVEVWGRRPDAERARLLEDYWSLLRTSHPVTPTANTDTHGIVHQEPGYPRTYLAVDDDHPANLSLSQVIDAIQKRRNVVLTNGPFVTVSIDNIQQGGLVSLASRSGKPQKPVLSIRVQRASWVDATTATVWVGGNPMSPISLAGKQTTPLGALVDELTVPIVLLNKNAKSPPKGGVQPISITSDTFIVVVVQGTRPLEPVLMDTANDFLPFAMTAPLWIDADGDGKALGR